MISVLITRSPLVEIRAISNSLRVTRREQFSKVLQVSLSSAIPAAVDDVIPEDDNDDNVPSGLR